MKNYATTDNAHQNDASTFQGNRGFFKKLDIELMLLPHEFINAAGNERNGVSIYLRRARAKLRMVDDNLGIARSLEEECLCISHPREKEDCVNAKIVLKQKRLGI